jgi:ribosomal protein L7/L12
MTTSVSTTPYGRTKVTIAREIDVHEVMDTLTIHGEPDAVAVIQALLDEVQGLQGQTRANQQFNKIAMIKAVRLHAQENSINSRGYDGLGLKEAKDLVEAAIAAHLHYEEEFNARRT